MEEYSYHILRQCQALATNKMKILDSEPIDISRASNKIGSGSSIEDRSRLKDGSEERSV